MESFTAREGGQLIGVVLLYYLLFRPLSFPVFLYRAHIILTWSISMVLVVLIPLHSSLPSPTRVVQHRRFPSSMYHQRLLGPQTRCADR